MEKIGLFIIYVFIWLLCVVSFAANKDNFLAWIGAVLLAIFLPSMMKVCGVV
jgi:isoprenylcysteine carboxyl methyltransferase (ICMT) family protein YpbQ